MGQGVGKGSGHFWRYKEDGCPDFCWLLDHQILQLINLKTQCGGPFHAMQMKTSNILHYTQPVNWTLDNIRLWCGS